MRDQYAGDVSDALKFAFLRALASTDRALGVAWYYVPIDDGGPDGRHLEWRGERAWQQLDARLHAGLSTLPERSVLALERAPIWPEGTSFHREPVPSNPHRKTWGERKREALAKSDIVFLDPDNGIGSESPRHATTSEIRLLRRPGRAVVFISFPGRLSHDLLIRSLHERLRDEAGATSAITLRTNVSVPRSEGSRYVVQRQRWFTIVDPDHVLTARTRNFAKALGVVPRVRAILDGVD